MAPPAGTLRVGRYFGALVVVLGLLYLVVFFPGQRHTPKLGIDLAGGKRVIFTARTGNGTAPTSSSMSQARQIIEDRINSTGVTNATVQVQGGNQLVVLIPGGTDTDVAQLGQPAILNFRPLIAPVAAVSCVSSTGSGSSTAPSSGSSAAKASGAAATSAGSAGANAVRDRPLTKPLAEPLAKASTSAAASATPTTSGTASGTSTASGTASGTGKPSNNVTVTAPASSTAAPKPCVTNPFATLAKGVTVPTTEAGWTALGATKQAQLTAALGRFDCGSAVEEPDQPSRYYVACDDGSTYGQRVAYLLGSVIVKGSQIDSASAQAPNVSGQGGSAEWTVALNLKSSGSDAWSSWTSKHNTNDATTANPLQCGSGQAFPCSVFVGFTLNGEVISAPYTSTTINGGTTQISGNFTQSSADDLAKQLNYGSLPLSFRADANQEVSATLGTQQLKAAFLAGGIGLALVVLYSLLYYRGLGIVTIASLVVSAGLTYAMLVILGTQIGFTLDLAGIAGFIVALGITADSFVVFFERIKDEVHEGRSIRVAVPRAWIRARRTILSADTVSFLAAAILYYFASADVKGFAFTLGMSTILDLVVVFLFTHPIVSLLSRSRTFGSPRFTGLNSVRTGAVIDDELPERRPRGGARTAGATRAPGGRSSAAQRAAARRPAGRTGTVVLDKPDAGDPTDPAETAEHEPGADLQTGADVDHDTEPATDLETGTGDEYVITDASASRADESDETRDTGPRRRSTPQRGTAAERAAARRARQRAQDDADGPTGGSGNRKGRS